jgi:signal transduction histidine kinase
MFLLKESFSQVISSSMKEQLDNCDMVKDSASMALETLEVMLTIDTIDENKLDLAVENLNIWKFVSEAVRPFSIDAIKAQIMFGVNCIEMEENWMQNFIIKADKFKLNQVLRNFVLSNTLKFCARSNGEVKVVVERKAMHAGEPCATYFSRSWSTTSS